MSIRIRPAKASDMEACADLYKHIFQTTYQGVVDSRLITSITQEDSVQRMRGDWLTPGANFFVIEETEEPAEENGQGAAGEIRSPEAPGEGESSESPDDLQSDMVKDNSISRSSADTDAYPSAVSASFAESDAEGGSEPLFLGYVSGKPSPDVLGAFWLEKLYLSESASGRGLGGRLIGYMAQEAVRQGYEQMVIDVFPGNDHAEQIYRHLGAETLSEDYVEEINLFPVHARLLIWEDVRGLAERLSAE